MGAIASTGQKGGRAEKKKKVWVCQKKKNPRSVNSPVESKGKESQLEGKSDEPFRTGDGRFQKQTIS